MVTVISNNARTFCWGQESILRWRFRWDRQHRRKSGTPSCAECSNTCLCLHHLVNEDIHLFHAWAQLATAFPIKINKAVHPFVTGTASGKRCAEKDVLVNNINEYQ